MPSVNKKPTASSKSWPGVRIVTETDSGSWPGAPALISIGSSVTTKSGFEPDRPSAFTVTTLTSVARLRATPVGDTELIPTD